MVRSRPLRGRVQRRWRQGRRGRRGGRRREARGGWRRRVEGKVGFDVLDEVFEASDVRLCCCTRAAHALAAASGTL